MASGNGATPPESRGAAKPAVDPEVEAIHQILVALKNLDEAAKGRVLDYVLVRIGRAPPSGHGTSGAAPEAPPTVAGPGPPAPPPGFRHTDIKSLKEEKQPGSLHEMATLVAFYLKEVATGEEHSDTVNAADIEKYFRQAGFKLPQRSIMALVNARQAGYLDPAGEPGVYKLNPVGYNLVAHSMPMSHRASAPSRSTKKPARPAKH